MMELEDGKGVWQRNLNLPWNQYKLLQETYLNKNLIN